MIMWCRVETLVRVSTSGSAQEFLRSLFFAAFGPSRVGQGGEKWHPAGSGYILPKLLHIKNLYQRVVRISRRPEVNHFDLRETRLFFWNGALVSSALLL